MKTLITLEVWEFFDEDFLEYLAGLPLLPEIFYAIPEGTVVFPYGTSF